MQSFEDDQGRPEFVGLCISGGQVSADHPDEATMSGKVRKRWEQKNLVKTGGKLQTNCANASQLLSTRFLRNVTWSYLWEYFRNRGQATDVCCSARPADPKLEPPTLWVKSADKWTITKTVVTAKCLAQADLVSHGSLNYMTCRY